MDLNFLLEQSSVEKVSENTFRYVRQHIPGYASMPTGSVLDDVRVQITSSVRSYFSCLASGRTPGHDAFEAVSRTARARVLQQIPLETVLTGYRVGLSLWWEHVMSVTPAERHGALAILTLAFSDVINDEVTVAYADEVAMRRATQQEELRMALTRMLVSQRELDAYNFGMLASLGVDPRGEWQVVLLTGLREQRAAGAPAQVLLPFLERLDEDFPKLVPVWVNEDLAILVSAGYKRRAIDLAKSTLATSPETREYAVGVGRAYRGITDISKSYAEAIRALALGRLLGKSGKHWEYADLEFLDLFKTGREIDDYVRNTLDPILNDASPKRRLRNLATLRAFFSNGMNRKKTARALGVHINTLSGRLSQLESSLGGDLTEGDFGFRVHLAVRMLPLLRE